MEELIQIVLKLKEATKQWNVTCKRRFYFSNVTLPRELYPLIDRLDTLIDNLLIDNYQNESRLTKETGVRFITLERDCFGPLRKGIAIGHGMVCYG